MWTYKQSSGLLMGPITATGYSGHGDGLNNPGYQTVHGIGPLPKGAYTIGEPLDPPDHLGPLAMPLTPSTTNVMFGRSAFFIHGDNAAMNHTASDGCIILPHDVRQAIANSADKDLLVIT